MSSNKEVEVALEAFNKVRAQVGGIKTDDQQRYAMNEAICALDRHRAAEKRANCEHHGKRGSGHIASDGSSSMEWWCPDCGASGKSETPARDGTSQPWLLINRI